MQKPIAVLDLFIVALAMEIQQWCLKGGASTEHTGIVCLLETCSDRSLPAQVPCTPPGNIVVKVTSASGSYLRLVLMQVPGLPPM